MRGQPGPPLGTAPATGSAGSSSGTSTTASAVSHLPQAHSRLPPAGIWAVSPHLQRTVTSSLFMKLLEGECKIGSATPFRPPAALRQGSADQPEARGCNLMVRDESGAVTYFSFRTKSENLSHP